jgi:hypothetical protein
MTPDKRFKCRLCGAVLPAWLLVFKAPNSAMLLQHWTLCHRGAPELQPLWERMRTECIDKVVVEAYEVVEGDE